MHEKQALVLLLGLMDLLADLQLLIVLLLFDDATRDDILVESHKKWLQLHQMCLKTDEIRGKYFSMVTKTNSAMHSILK